MKTITLPEPQQLGPIELRADVAYLMDDANAGYMLAWPGTRIADWTANPQIPSATTRNLLIIRAGGYGDLLFLTPAIRKLRQQFPAMHISVACVGMYHAPMGQHFECVEYPVELDRLRHFDCVVPLENLIEFGEPAQTMHAVELFAMRLGVALEDSEKTLQHTIEPALGQRMQREHPYIAGNGKRCPRIGIAMSASARIRSYPTKLMHDLITQLRGRSCETVVFGRPGECANPTVKGFINATALNLSFCESLALASTCDVVIAPDSALTHFCGAAGIPVIALYGPFPWQLRTDYQPTVRSIQGRAPCAPCYHPARGGQHFVPGQPCAETGWCAAMESIEPRRVVAEVMKILRGKLNVNVEATRGLKNDHE
jgi:ADP-heptose:LPS heptosyltransferase